MTAQPVLVLNGGSSSWKSALLDMPAPEARADATAAAPPQARAALAWQREGSAAQLSAAVVGGATLVRDVRAQRTDAVPVLLAAYRELGCELANVAAVGHRIVHGGPHFAGSVRIDEAAVAALRALEPFAPSHNPVELAGIAAARAALPGAVHVAAFDTAFHRTLPEVAYTYGGPYAWLEGDIRRYGFHGLSVAYCSERAARLLARDPGSLRLAVAHLGGGCSVTAVRAGASIDTTMGFTPLDGLVMGTRSGAVDPGILLYLLRRAGERSAAAAADDLENTLTREAGLLGLAGTSDVRELLAAERNGDARAARALDVFAYRAAAAVGAFVPALGGLDALVFTGGIGANAAAVRARVCESLRACGVTLAANRNADPGGADADVAEAGSAVRVLVVAANEEWYIARECARILVGTGHV